MCHSNVFIVRHLCKWHFCFGLLSVELLCEYLPRVWVFLGVCAWRLFSLSVELLEFIMSHHTPWSSRARISSGHLKMLQSCVLHLVLGMWCSDGMRKKNVYKQAPSILLASWALLEPSKQQTFPWSGECVCFFEGWAGANGSCSDWGDFFHSSPEIFPICSPTVQTAGQRVVNSSAAGVMEAAGARPEAATGGEVLCLLLSPCLFC